MAKKTTKFMVGLFTVLGVLLGVAVIIWIGATRFFEQGERYVTYFDESVQGLQRDASVKYRGVEVGRVEDIKVAPDNKLIAVVMKINLRGDLSKNIVAQLKVAGITGMVFVELNHRDPQEKDQSPKITFASEYPIIPSRPSELSKILGGVNVVVEKFNQMDTRGVVDQVKATAAEIEVFFKGPRMEAILNNVETTLVNIKNFTGRLDKLMASGKVDSLLTEGTDTLVGARTFIAAVKDEMGELHLKEAIRKASSITGEVKATSENLRQATETLDSFLGRINDRPPDLLFGKPPKPRFNE